MGQKKVARKEAERVTPKEIKAKKKGKEVAKAKAMSIAEARTKDKAVKAVKAKAVKRKLPGVFGAALKLPHGKARNTVASTVTHKAKRAPKKAKPNMAVERATK